MYGMHRYTSVHIGMNARCQPTVFLKHQTNRKLCNDIRKN